MPTKDTKRNGKNTKTNYFLLNSEYHLSTQKDAWFAERYHPDIVKELDTFRKGAVQRAHTAFLKSCSQNCFEGLSLRVRDLSLLGTVAMERDDQPHMLGSHAIEINLFPQVTIALQPFFGFDSDSHTLFIKSVPRQISRVDILKAVVDLPGFKDLTMSDPVRKIGLHRYCWLDFWSEEAATKAELVLSGLIVREESLCVGKSQSKTRRVKVLRNYPMSRTAIDLETASRLIQTLCRENQIQDCLPLLHRQPQNAHFDMLLLYLRRVHAYDYFASLHCDNERTLCLKLGSAFLRVEADYEQPVAVTTVFKRMQQSAVIRADVGDEKVNLMEVQRQQIQKLIREQRANKPQNKSSWNCFHCTKRFYSCDFLAKHMLAKHPEMKLPKIQRVMEQAYLNDPHRLTLAYFRDDRMRKPFSQRRDRARQYRDLDQPEGTIPAIRDPSKRLINFLDI